MAEFASPQETQRALGYLLKLQEDPETLEGFFNKYPDANPFSSWPFPKEPTEAFLRYFEKSGPEPAQGAEATLLANSIDDLKLKELIEEFDREYAAANEQQVNAASASKKFVKDLFENARKSHVIIPEPQAPAVPEEERASEVAGIAEPRPVPPMSAETEWKPVSPERVQSIISAAVQYPGPPEEKTLVFHALTSFASEQPEKTVSELLPRAVEVTETARVLSTPTGTFPPAQSFSVLATNNFQKGVALALDAVVPPAAKEAIINKILLQPLDTLVNHPEKIPPDIMGTMTDRWGANFVNSSWFTAIRADANRMIGDQKGALKVTTRFGALVSDVATTVFRRPVTTTVVTYIETYRLVATQGVPMVSTSHYNNIVLGYGGQLVRVGANYVIKKGVKAGVKAAAEKAAASAAVKVGAEAVAGAASGGTITLAMLAANALGWLKDRGASLLKSLLFMGNSKNPEDNLLLVVGAGIVLVFFLPLFPLLNIPAFNQSMIDTSLATARGAGGPTGSSGPTGPIGPIGPITRSCANTAGIGLSQFSLPWGPMPFGGGYTIAQCACGPTSDAMIFKAFGAGAQVQDVVSNVLTAMGGYKGCYTDDAGNTQVLKNHSLRVIDIGTSCTEAANYLSKSCGVILAQGHNIPHDTDHYVVIVGISCSGDTPAGYNVYDPAYYTGLTLISPSQFALGTMYAVINPAGGH